MSEKFGSFLNNFRPLSHYINNEIKETLHKNEAYKDNRSNFLEKSIISWSNHYKIYLFLLFLLCFMVGWNAHCWMSYIPAYIKIEKDSSLLGVLLTGQITIIGLIYPLVISLVSILFQDKAGKKVIFSLYQKFSGFMFAGLSGLSLTIILAFSLIFNKNLTDKLSFILNITLTFWFIFNLFLMIWFFVKTLSVLDERKKDEFIFRFVTNQICEFDLKKLIRDVYIEDLFKYNLLRARGNDLLITSNAFMLKEHEGEINYCTKRSKELRNISLWKINLALWLQIEILKRSKSKVEPSDFNFQICIPKSTYRRKKVTLAKYSGFKINCFVLFLIRSSVKYKKNNNRTGVGILSALEAFTSPVYIALDNNDEGYFIESLNRLVKYHIQLVEVLDFESPDGEPNNWLFVDKGVWSSSYFTDFIRSYHILLEKTINKIPTSTQYFSYALYFYRNIYSARENINDIETNAIFRNVLYLWSALLKWKNQSNDSNIVIENSFNDAIHKFVSVWEQWKSFYIMHKYKDINKSYPVLFEHMKYTAEMVVESLRIENDQALGWSTDMLVHWKSGILKEGFYNEKKSWHSKVIDIEMLFEENADLWFKIRRGNVENLDFAIKTALKNAYVDIRFLTVCSILANSDDVLRVKPYIDALLQENRIYPTGTSNTKVEGISQANQVLGIYIRCKKFHLGGIDIDSEWQVRLIENSNRKFSQKMVSGRTYAGRHNVSIDKEFIQLIVSYSSNKWKLSGDWLNTLKSDIYSFSNREDMTRNFRGLIDIAQKTSKYKLLSSEKTHEEVVKYRTNFVESMEELIDEIEKINNSHVINSGVDKKVLYEMAKVASNDFIAYETKFPLNIFGAINRDGVELISNNQVSVRDFEKSYIMSDDRPSIHSSVEGYGEGIANNLRNVILRKIFINKPTSCELFDSLEDMLFFILNEIKTPDAVLLCHQSISDLIFDLLNEDEQKLEILQITKNYSENYICRIGDCEVYSNSFDILDSCILTTKNRFKALVIEDFEDGNVVNVVFNENEQDKTKGNLSFDYKLDIETDKTIPFIKLSLTPKNIESDEEAVEEHTDNVIQEELHENKVPLKINRFLKFLSTYRR
ncbi:hypothetical protein [Psychrobacter sp. TB55-MNA-CIBAN-0194]|uniref:hypothetical protein n=1 Tax=Psychrobacter sp. TB55-MNA-CIBAN-0194 TaxID=3140445 RepID=UPI003330B2EE